MPLWLQIAVGIAAGTLLALGLLVAVAWLAAWAVEIVDRARLRRGR